MDFDDSVAEGSAEPDRSHGAAAAESTSFRSLGEAAAESTSYRSLGAAATEPTSYRSLGAAEMSTPAGGAQAATPITVTARSPFVQGTAAKELLRGRWVQLIREFAVGQAAEEHGAM